jgi:hypothetical protein
LPEDTARWEANRDHNEKMWAWKEKKQARSAAHRAVKERGEDTPSESDSSDEAEEEGEVTPSPLSPPRITLPHSLISLVGRWGLWSVSASRNEIG